MFFILKVIVGAILFTKFALSPFRNNMAAKKNQRLQNICNFLMPTFVFALPVLAGFDLFVTIMFFALGILLSYHPMFFNENEEA